MQFTVTKNTPSHILKGYYKTGELWLKTFRVVKGEDEYISFMEGNNTPRVETVADYYVWENFEYTPIYDDEEVKIILEAYPNTIKSNEI